MKKVLVLGGGADQIDLILDLKSRGYYTILIDYYENPIAKPYADEHLQVSTLDQDLVLKIAQQKQVENIITACTDQALLTVSYVAEKLNFHTQFTYEQARNVTNKLYMKRIMWDAKIPTSKFVDICNLSEGIKDLKFPLMVKPADCNGSFGVRKANTKDELQMFFDNASNASRTHRVIVEEFKEGIEVGIDCYILNGKAHILMCGQVNKKKINDSVLLIFQTFIPAIISEKAMQNIQWIADHIAQAFHLDNTPLLIQTLVDGDEVNVIEFAPRIGGASKHRTIKIKTGFDILHANVGCVLTGEVPDIKVMDNPYYYSRNHIYAYPCSFDRIECGEKLIQLGILEELVPFKTSGMVIGNNMASRDRVGSFLVKGKTMDELREKISIAVNELRVYDINGNEVMNREIFR